MEHIEHLDKIKKMVGDLIERFSKEDSINERDIATVKEAVSAYQKLCELCEEDEGGGYGENRRYGARRRDSRGRYMTGRGGDGYGMGGGYGWMPGPYYAGGNYGGDSASLADELERMASSGMGDPEMVKSLREAARHLRKG